MNDHMNALKQSCSSNDGTGNWAGPFLAVVSNTFVRDENVASVYQLENSEGKAAMQKLQDCTHQSY